MIAYTHLFHRRPSSVLLAKLFDRITMEGILAEMETRKCMDGPCPGTSPAEAVIATSTRLASSNLYSHQLPITTAAEGRPRLPFVLNITRSS